MIHHWRRSRIIPWLTFIFILFFIFGRALLSIVGFGFRLWFSRSSGFIILLLRWSIFITFALLPSTRCWLFLGFFPFSMVEILLLTTRFFIGFVCNEKSIRLYSILNLPKIELINCKKTIFHFSARNSIFNKILIQNTFNFENN